MLDDIRSLLDGINRIHTTELGIERITRNTGIDGKDVVDWCKKQIEDKDSRISIQGKNWYIATASYIITVNRTSFTIITAHKISRYHQ